MAISLILVIALIACVAAYVGIRLAVGITEPPVFPDQPPTGPVG